MEQHRAVQLVEQAVMDFDDVVRTNAEDVLVVCGMVDLAQRETVGYDRRFAIIERIAPRGRAIATIATIATAL